MTYSQWLTFTEVYGTELEGLTNVANATATKLGYTPNNWFENTTTVAMSLIEVAIANYLGVNVANLYNNHIFTVWFNELEG